MAYYEHLPIYRKAMETAVYFEKIVRNFSRYKECIRMLNGPDKSLVSCSKGFVKRLAK